MLYINDPTATPLPYAEAVDIVAKSGIRRERAYLYLAAHGIKGGLGKQMSDDFNGYMKPVKYAIKGNTILSTIKTCDECGCIVVK